MNNQQELTLLTALYTAGSFFAGQGAREFFKISNQGY